MAPRQWTVGVLAFALLVLTGCSDLQGTDGKQYVAGEGQIVTFDPEDRGAPVQARGEAVDGGELDLADYRGRVVIANVWWSGCGPCRKELPLLAGVAQEVGEDAALLGINVREVGVDNSRSFLREVGVDLPSFYDPGSEVLLAFSPETSPTAIPSTAVLDRDGRLAALVTGELRSPVTLRDVVDDIAAETGAASHG